PSSLRNDPEGLEGDLRLGAGFALALSDRAQLYGEYRFLRGRVDSGVGRGLLQREPGSPDFRAGFSLPLHLPSAAAPRCITRSYISGRWLSSITSCLTRLCGFWLSSI